LRAINGLKVFLLDDVIAGSDDDLSVKSCRDTREEENLRSFTKTSTKTPHQRSINLKPKEKKSKVHRRSAFFRWKKNSPGPFSMQTYESTSTRPASE
jgi:hypothetical protein